MFQRMYSGQNIDKKFSITNKNVVYVTLRLYNFKAKIPHFSFKQNMKPKLWA